ncbi:MAG: cobyric acid synthase CobQ, partial [Vibrio sp.]|nr:cobyric acid synthase CobQ [Vibrio sp.]
NIVVPVLTRISNHTDFDALRLNPDVDLRYVGKGERIENADLILLPGSKSVRDDLAYLRSQGWDQDIKRHLRFGGKVMGICGGYQMLGRVIRDPLDVEGGAGESEGLGLLNVSTELTAEKTLRNVQGELILPQGKAKVSGYEIHVGRTTFDDASSSAIITLDNGNRDGLLSDCQQVLGTYMHGIFDSFPATELICRWAGAADISYYDHVAQKEQAINRIADAIEEHLNLALLWPELTER